MSAQLEEARRQRRLGRWCVPLKPKSKAPAGGEDWNKARLDEQELARDFRGKDYNVGLLLGIDGLIHVDLDCAEAIALADAYLPPTGLESGHGATPRAARFYMVKDLPDE
jgi:hypothetical protein